MYSEGLAGIRFWPQELWRRLFGCVQIGVLAHLPLDFGPFFFVVQQSHPIPKVLPLYLALGSAEQPGVRVAELLGFSEFLIAVSGFKPKPIPQNIVVEGQVLAVGSRVSLAATTTDQLAVDSSRIMKFGADDHHSSQSPDAVFEFHVGTSSRHVGRHGDLALLSGQAYDFRFAFDLVGVEHLNR